MPNAETPPQTSDLSDLKSLTDEALARRSAAGSEAAFTELMRRHKHGLYQYLTRLCFTHEQRYEATQETFIKVWFNIRRYDPKRPFVAWLRTVAANVARDLHKKRKVRRIVFGDAEAYDGAIETVADTAGRPDEALIEKDRADTLRTALAQLPVPMRRVLSLVVFEGRSHKEAGAVLGLTDKAVEMRLARARKALARAVQGA